MKMIGQGWQYKVYDLGGGRVLKRKRNAVNQFLRIFFEPIFEGKYSITSTLKEIQLKNSHTEKMLAVIKVLILENSENNEINVLLAYPEFINKFDHMQNTVVILQDYFLEHAEEENKRILDNYVALLLSQWRFGISDSTFNFSANNGIDPEGRVVLADLGELTDSREKVKQYIIDKKWLNKISFYNLPTQNLKDYFTQIMDKNITLEKLEETWKKSFKNS